METSNFFSALAAVASAIAAFASAITAYIAVRIQNAAFIQSVRPEFFPFDWDRTGEKGDSRHEIIYFKRLCNVGKGVAFNLLVNVQEQINKDSGRTLLCEDLRIPVFAADETMDVGFQIHLYWKDIEPCGFVRSIVIPVKFSYLDYRWVEHTMT